MISGRVLHAARNHPTMHVCAFLRWHPWILSSTKIATYVISAFGNEEGCLVVKLRRGYSLLGEW